MKSPLSNFYFPFSITILVLIAACNNQNSNHTSSASNQYTCPMHPTVLQDKPGTCPICAMDLVRKGQPGEEVKITAELNYLLKPTNAMVISSIKTVMPVMKSIEIFTNANGIITYDTRRFTSIPIRFGGRIEKLPIRYNFQPIHKGQKVLEIYSPELVTAQRDLLYLIKSDSENPLLINGAKEKLRLIGISDSQINQLVSSGQESYSFSVYSPVDGYIVEAASSSISPSSQPSPGAGSMNGGMAGATSAKVQQTSSSSASGELLTREGSYVNTGQVIFKVVNTDYLWAEFDVYQQDAGQININDSVVMTVDNSKEVIKAKVSFVQPFFKNNESFIKVRVYLPNTESKFQIGQLLTASFITPSNGSLWIPISARLDLGSKIIAFTKRRGVFRAKAIVTARKSDQWVEVLDGLEASDSIAYNAQFMIDSESFIKVRN